MIATDLIDYYASTPPWGSRLKITLDSPEGQRLLEEAKLLAKKTNITDMDRYGSHLFGLKPPAGRGMLKAAE